MNQSLAGEEKRSKKAKILKSQILIEIWSN